MNYTNFLNMRSSLTISFMGILFCACSHTTKPVENWAGINNQPLKTLQIDSTVNITPSQIIADISCVRLSTSWKYMIGRAEQVLFADDKIIVFDRYKAKAVFVFDKNGKFLNKIGMLGHGPQEYVEPSYIALVPEKNQIAVFDFSPKKVKIYNLDGKFVRSEDIPIYLFSAEYLTDQVKVGATIGRRYFYTLEYERASLFMFNKNWDVTSTGFQDPFQEALTFISTNNLKKFGDRVYYTPAYEDRIYRVYQDSIQLLYQLDLGEQALPVPEKYQITDSKVFGKLLDRSTAFNGVFVDTKDWMMLSISDNTWVHAYFYNKTTDLTYFLNRNVDMLSNLVESYLDRAIYYCNDSCIVACIDATTVASMNSSMRGFAKIKPETHTAQMNQMIEDLSAVTENDNPVLFFFTLKN